MRTANKQHIWLWGKKHLYAAKQVAAKAAFVWCKVWCDYQDSTFYWCVHVQLGTEIGYWRCVIKHICVHSTCIQVPQLGFPGLPGYGLSGAQVKKLQRFGPVEFCKQLSSIMYLPDSALTQHENSHLHHTPSGKRDYPSFNNAVMLDTIGFFIAKFVNLSSCSWIT